MNTPVLWALKEGFRRAGSAYSAAESFVFLYSCWEAGRQRLCSKLHFNFNFSPSWPMGVQSLPTVLPESFNTSDKNLEIRSAYSMSTLPCLILIPKIHERKLIHARVLSHLLWEAPTMHASENVVNQVNSCRSNGLLDALGEMYFLHYICACERLCLPVVVRATLMPCG